MGIVFRTITRKFIFNLSTFNVLKCKFYSKAFGATFYIICVEMLQNWRQFTAKLS